MSRKGIEKKYRNTVYQHLEVPDQLDDIKSRITFENQSHKATSFHKLFQARLSYAVMFLLIIGASLIVYQQVTYSNISDQHYEEFKVYAQQNTDEFLIEPHVVKYRFITENLSIYIGESEGQIILLYLLDYPFDLYKKLTFEISGQVFETNNTYGIIELSIPETEPFDIHINFSFRSILIPDISVSDNIDLQPYVELLRQ
jgi:hypothetical protein